MPGRARNFRFRSCYKDGCISSSKIKILIFVFVSAHVIRTLFLVTPTSENEDLIFRRRFEWPKLPFSQQKNKKIVPVEFMMPILPLLTDCCYLVLVVKTNARFQSP